MSARVSCVIPVRDGRRFLEAALGSALAQTLPPAEIIVVDDGSTDGSGEVAAAADPAVRVLRHEVSVGAPAARAAGVRAASGDLLAFLDADDLWLPERLEQQIAHLDGPERLDVSFCEIENFWEPGQEAEAARWRAAGRVRGTWMITTALARREVLDAVPLPEDARYVDHLRWAVALRDAGVAVGALPRALVRRRRHEDNLSRRDADDHYDELFDVLKARMDRRRDIADSS